MKALFYRLLHRLTDFFIPRHGGIDTLAGKKVLVIRWDHLGDMIMMTPVFRALAGQSGAAVDVVCGSWNLPVLEKNPFVRRVYVYNDPRLTRGQKKTDLFAAIRLLYQIRRERYDVLFNYMWELRSQLFAAMTGAALQAGYDVAFRGGFNHLTVPFEGDDVHAVTANLNFLRNAGLSKIPAAARVEIFNIAPTASFPTPPFFVIHPGAGNPQKRWGNDRYAKLIRRLRQAFKGFHILYTGVADEVPVVNDLQKKAGGRSFAGRTTFAETCAIIKQAAAVISNDTGVLHMAAALDTPVVSIHLSHERKYYPHIKKRLILHRFPEKTSTERPPDEIIEEIVCFLKTMV